MNNKLPIRIENMIKNTFTEEQIKVKENLDEVLQTEVNPQAPLEEFNDYLRLLADMDNIGIRRKLFLLEGYMNKIINQLKNA